MFCPNCGASVNDGNSFCANCGAPLSTANAQQPQYQQPLAPEPKMKWFKFIIYFGLFAGALVNFLSGFSLLTGSIYEGDAELVYAFFDELESIDTLVGIALIALAAFGVFVRFRLSGFYQNGPALLNATYIAAIVISIVYLMGVSSVLGDFAEGMDFSSYISSVVSSIAMVIINTIYFKKRKHLFVN